MIALMILLLGLQTAPADGVEPRPLQISIDDRGTTRCMGGLVGFRNVPVQCVVGRSGALEDCELLTDNRDVLRYSERFRCMAGHVTVTYPDGSPATGRQVRTRLNGDSGLSSRSRN